MVKETLNVSHTDQAGDFENSVCHHHHYDLFKKKKKMMTSFTSAHLLDVRSSTDVGFQK